MVEALTIYRKLITARARAQLQYRTSFVLDLIGAFFVAFTDFLAILIIFRHIPSMGGWTVAQVAFLYGTSCLAFAFTDLVLGHLDSFPTLIREGSFDVILVRPLGSLFQVISGDIALRRIGKALQAVLVLSFAVSRLDIAWSPLKLGMLLVSIASGVIIFSAVWIIGAAVVFWTVDTFEVTNAFTYGGSFLTQYPINIYGTWVRRFLAFIVPMAFVSYFPALYILDKADPLGLPSFLMFMSAPVAVLSALIAGAVWRFAVRHYTSTGS
ncbi:MAG: ABC-2 family transporter protein [Actinomycetota bacterium]